MTLPLPARRQFPLPVVAALVGVAFLHEHLTGWFLAGSALVLVCIMGAYLYFRG